MDKLERYRKLEYQLPSKNVAWRAYQAGVENFGKDGQPDDLPMLKPKAGEVLLRVDTIGICFSDVKLVTQGSTHARIVGRDLVNEPVIPGHEVSLTVIEAGDDCKDKYKPGDRFIVQADVYFKGKNLAFGYVLPGGMQQFVIVGEEVLAGDEGSYLIPTSSEVGYAEAALVEPWTCVVASYRIHPRRTALSGGKMLVVQFEDKGFKFDEALFGGGCPEFVVLAGVSADVKSQIAGLCKSAKISEVGKPAAEAVKPLSDENTAGVGFDDIIVLGTPSPAVAEALGGITAHNGVMAISAEKPIGEAIKIDVGRVHYDYIDFVGTTSTRVADAYVNSRDSELKPGGTAWFIGAAGPMGQMHVQRAVRDKNGPKKMLCTDVDNDRLNYLRDAVIAEAEARGVEVVFMNPMEVGQPAVDAEIARMTDDKGFDDVIVLAPVAALIAGSVKYLGQGGLMNIFAGVPRGTIATMDLSVTYAKGNRFVGSSGSRPQDMVDTLHYTEVKDLPTKNSMAAVGGIDAMFEGLVAVKTAKFPGKTVIFPQITLPLTELAKLHEVLPNVAAKLEAGKFWTQEAEDELLRTKLEI